MMKTIERELIVNLLMHSGDKTRVKHSEPMGEL